MAKILDSRFEAYAQHGKAGEPMRTERVDVRLRPTKAGNYQVLLNGRWCRLRDGYAIQRGERFAINLVRNEA